MVADRRDALTDDLISELIRAEHDGDRLDADELRMLVVGLLIAGTDTTRNQLAASVQVLCDHPDQWALLAQHPELAANAVEETMRHSPIAWGTLRVALEDVELAGVVIPAGTLVVANTASANRDPTVYDKPDQLDITRDGAPHADLRCRHALLPRRQPRAARTRRSTDRHDTADAKRPAHRACAVETVDRPDWSRHAAHRIRRRANQLADRTRLARYPRAG